MKYEDIKDFNQRCEEHPAHQTGMISERMIQARLSEEIDELRAYIEQRTKVVFPTMLRKMWSGGEVQAWLDENVNKENT